MLSLVVLSHRHNKEETVTGKNNHQELDFSLVRDTMYKYSKKSQERFFSNHYLTFLFLNFATNEEGIKFINSKFEEKGNEYLQRIKQEMNELVEEAMEAILKMRNAKGCKELICFIQNIEK